MFMNTSSTRFCKTKRRQQVPVLDRAADTPLMATTGATIVPKSDLLSRVHKLAQLHETAASFPVPTIPAVSRPRVAPESWATHWLNSGKLFLHLVPFRVNATEPTAR
jgi:hypothetical protein